YARKKTWDDRARMPEFRFARSRRKPNESAGDYEARTSKEEAEAREAVETFVLGLVAEPVPEKSINRPTGDRLAEVEGRQILDKYNCAGCHVVREGVVEFKLDADVTARLMRSYNTNKGSWEKDHPFLNHKNWAGKPPASPDRIMVRGINPQFKVEEDPDDPNVKNNLFRVRLTQALSFPGPGGLLTIRANPLLGLPPSGLVYPPQKVAENPETLRRFLRDQGPYGGAYTDLLVDFLVERDKAKGDQFFKRNPETGEAPEAQTAAPPLLIGQGERTQADWLYNFL